VPLFGLTPRPVTILTLGCLLLTTGPVPWWDLVIPLVWSPIGGTAAFLLGVAQDWILLVSGVATEWIVAATGPVRPTPVATISDKRKSA
jgi:hypothetical protein